MRVSSSPTLRMSAGVAMGRLDICEMWSRPSTPGSSSTKAPKSGRRGTLAERRGHGLALLEQLGRMPDIAGPGHVRDVEQAVHPGLQLHEGAEVGEVAHLALHPLPGLVALGDGGPR